MPTNCPVNNCVRTREGGHNEARPSGRASGTGFGRVQTPGWGLRALAGEGIQPEQNGYIIGQGCRTAPDWTNSTRLVDFCQDAADWAYESGGLAPQYAPGPAGAAGGRPPVHVSWRNILTYLEAQQDGRDADAGCTTADPGWRSGGNLVRAARRPMVAGDRQGDAGQRRLLHPPGHHAGSYRRNRLDEGVAPQVIRATVRHQP